jgi:hypothetical protein
LLLALARVAFLRSESPRTQYHISLSQIPDWTNVDGQVPVFISPQEQGGPIIPPGTGFHFCRLLQLAGLRWKYSNPPPSGVIENIVSNGFCKYTQHYKAFIMGECILLRM